MKSILYRYKILQPSSTQEQENNKHRVMWADSAKKGIEEQKVIKKALDGLEKLEENKEMNLPEKKL